MTRYIRAVHRDQEKSPSEYLKNSIVWFPFAMVYRDLAAENKRFELEGTQLQSPQHIDKGSTPCGYRESK